MTLEEMTHQGHRDGRPSLYHINVVDSVTQWQVVGCAETIADRHLLPLRVRVDQDSGAQPTATGLSGRGLPYAV
jgi:hypothetical protein